MDPKEKYNQSGAGQYEAANKMMEKATQQYSAVAARIKAIADAQTERKERAEAPIFAYNPTCN